MMSEKTGVELAEDVKVLNHSVILSIIFVTAVGNIYRHNA